MKEDWSTFGFLYGTVPPAPTTFIYAAAFGMEEDLVSLIVYVVELNSYISKIQSLFNILSCFVQVKVGAFSLTLFLRF